MSIYYNLNLNEKLNKIMDIEEGLFKTLDKVEVAMKNKKKLNKIMDIEVGPFETLDIVVVVMKSYEVAIHNDSNYFRII